MQPTDPLLKTQQVATALGMSASTIKRWVDSGLIEASRTLGRHRLIRLSEALRFARAHGLPDAHLELLLGLGTAHLDAIGERTCEALAEMLREGRGREARTLVHSVYGSGLPASDLADRLIRPVLERIGHGWMVGALDIYQEHHASQLLASALMDLVDRTVRAQSDPAPLALGAATEGDPYLLPGLLGELVLREAGWDVRNLGVNLPLRSLARAVGDHRPRLVYVSVSHLADEERFVREYLKFYETAAATDAAVIVGGRALRPDLRARLIFASYGDRMAHLSEFARSLRPASLAATRSTHD